MVVKLKLKGIDGTPPEVELPATPDSARGLFHAHQTL